MTRREPTIDPTTSGISFVDILFALAVGQILVPLVPWAENHTKNSLPAPIVWNLVVGIVLILTSFIGYHNSENRPRFTIRFINVSFCKFFLDISMVILYFLFASFALVSPAQSQSLLLLILLIFGLYTVWDIAGWYEKNCGDYKKVWKREYANPNRPDIVDAWTPVNYFRTVPTVVCLIISAVLYYWSLQHHTPLPRHDVIRLDVVLVVLLLAYRIVKDHIQKKVAEPDDDRASDTAPKGTFVATVNASPDDLAAGILVAVASADGPPSVTPARTPDVSA